jgi:hypothetical protein
MTKFEEDATQERPKSRRELLGVAGVGAAALAGGAALASPRDAQAADGDPLIIGQTNSGTLKTQLDNSGTIVDDGAHVVNAPNADFGAVGVAGVFGAFGVGTVGVGGDGLVGGVFFGDDASISLVPRSAPGPPTGQNFQGDLAIDSDGVLWLCIADGAPATWIRVSHGGVRMLGSPQRAYDSRLTGGRFGAGETRDVAIAGVVPGVPAGALGFVGNIAVTQTSSFGWVTAFPAGTPYPGTATINWSFLDQTLNNATTVGLGTGADAGEVSLFASSETHVILDVSGYVL